MVSLFGLHYYVYLSVQASSFLFAFNVFSLEFPPFCLSHSRIFNSIVLLLASYLCAHIWLLICLQNRAIWHHCLFASIIFCIFLNSRTPIHRYVFAAPIHKQRKTSICIAGFCRVVKLSCFFSIRSMMAVLKTNLCTNNCYGLRLASKFNPLIVMYVSWAFDYVTFVVVAVV